MTGTLTVLSARTGPLGVVMSRLIGVASTYSTVPVVPVMSRGAWADWGRAPGWLAARGGAWVGGAAVGREVASHARVVSSTASNKKGRSRRGDALWRLPALCCAIVTVL